MTPARALVVGCGYVGLRLVRALVAEGLAVFATNARAEHLDPIREAGAEAILADPLEPQTLRHLLELRPTVVFDLVPPQRLAPGRFTVWGTRNVAGLFLGSPLEAIVYLSSTSVYEPRPLKWLDERSDVQPTSAFGGARVEAERLYLELWRERGLPARICRAPVIYGPGRTLRARLETGAYSRIDDDEQWVSRIHVDDLATALLAAWRRGRDGEVYLLSDDEPVTGREYARLTAELLAVPLPPPLAREDIRQELGDGGFDRRIPVGRCSNRRMRDELGVRLRYPTVREGVPASLREEGAI